MIFTGSNFRVDMVLPYVTAYSHHVVAGTVADTISGGVHVTLTS